MVFRLTGRENTIPFHEEITRIGWKYLNYNYSVLAENLSH